MSTLHTVRMDFESEAVEFATYNKLDRSVTIKYTSGGLYTYSRVPFKVFDKMRRTKSVGRFIAKNIKGIYAFVREN